MKAFRVKGASLARSLRADSRSKMDAGLVSECLCCYATFCPCKGHIERMQDHRLAFASIIKTPIVHT